LKLDWSPAQISGWLKGDFPDDETMRVSHEAIYRSLFIQARGVLKKELIGHLRGVRVMRASKKAGTEGQPRGRIVDAFSIRERPAEVEDRAIPGHWEGDLLSDLPLCRARSPHARSMSTPTPTLTGAARLGVSRRAQPECGVPTSDTDQTAGQSGGASHPSANAPT
jgi:hypothetical protein